MSLTEVTTLYDSTLHDAPAKLRELADAIEAGNYGEVGCVAVAVFGDTLEVFGYGPDSEGPSTALVLQAGALKFAQSLVNHGRDEE